MSRLQSKGFGPKLVVNNTASGGGPPPDDRGGGGGDNGGMDITARVTRLEGIATDTRERVAKIESAITTLATKHDVEKMNSDTVKWIIGTAVALGGVAITVMTFVLNNAVPRPAQQSTSQPPIVIQVPAPQQPTQPPAK